MTNLNPLSDYWLFLNKLKCARSQLQKVWTDSSIIGQERGDKGFAERKINEPELMKWKPCTGGEWKAWALLKNKTKKQNKIKQKHIYIFIYIVNMKEKIFSFLWKKICSKHMGQAPASPPHPSHLGLLIQELPIGLGSFAFLGIFHQSTECDNIRKIVTRVLQWYPYSILKFIPFFFLKIFKCGSFGMPFIQQ